jgi:hypothetical protein
MNDSPAERNKSMEWIDVKVATRRGHFRFVGFVVFDITGLLFRVSRRVYTFQRLGSAALAFSWVFVVLPCIYFTVLYLCVFIRIDLYINIKFRKEIVDCQSDAAELFE